MIALVAVVAFTALVALAAHAAGAIATNDATGDRPSTDRTRASGLRTLAPRDPIRRDNRSE